MKNIIVLIICSFFFINSNGQSIDLFGSKTVAIQENSISTKFDESTGVLILNENMDNVSLLPSNGWLLKNIDGGGTTSFFQGNTSGFEAYNGATDSYLAQNFNGANGSLIDQWIITPKIYSRGETSFSFMYKSANTVSDSYPDHIYIYYSPTGSSKISDFTLLKNKTTVPDVWTQFSDTINSIKTVRFAIRYYETNGGPDGDDSNYWGLDAIQVTGNPPEVPVAFWSIFGIFALLFSIIIIRKLFL